MLDSQDLPPLLPPKSVSITEVVSWGVIAVVLGVIFFSQFKAQSSEESRHSQELFQVRLMSRYFVGYAQWFRWVKSGASNLGKSTLKAQLESHTKKPLERLYYAPVIFELEGGKEVLKWLAPLLADSSLSPELRSDVLSFSRIYAASPEPLSIQVKHDLLNRYGWNARLALAHSADAPAGELQELQGQALMTLALVVTGIVVGLAGGAIGMVLLILAVIKGLNRSLKTSYVRPELGQVGDAYIGAFGFYLLLYIVLGFLLQAALYLLSVKMSVVEMMEVHMVMQLLYLTGCLLFLRWRGVAFSSIRQAMGWHGGKGWIREVGAGFVGYLAGLPLMLLSMYTMTYLAHRIGWSQPSHPMVEWLSNASWGTWIAVMVVAAVAAPIFEEIMFRGLLYPKFCIRGK